MTDTHKQLSHMTDPGNAKRGFLNDRMPVPLGVSLSVVWAFITGAIIVATAPHLGDISTGEAMRTLVLPYALIGLPLPLFFAWLGRPAGTNRILGDHR